VEKVLLFFLQGIPEITGIVALGLALLGVPLRWGIITVAGTVLTVIIFIIRNLPLSFGLHTVIAALLLAFFIAKTTRVSTAKSIIAAFVSFSILLVLELTINKIFFTVTKLDPQVVISNNLSWTLLGLPQAIIMILLAVIVSKVKKPDKRAWKFNSPSV